MKNRKKTVRDGIDSEIIEYIDSVSLRKVFYGIDEDSMWAVINRIQKHYEDRNRELEIKYEAQKELLNRELDSLGRKNTELRQKLIWLIDKIRTAGVTVNE